jgi:hypothetical protein
LLKQKIDFLFRTISTRKAIQEPQKFGDLVFDEVIALEGRSGKINLDEGRDEKETDE